MGHRRRRPSRPSTPLPFHRYLPPFHRDLSERYRCLPRSIGPRWHSRGWAPLLSLPAPAEALSLQHPRFLVGEGSDPLGKGGGWLPTWPWRPFRADRFVHRRRVLRASRRRRRCWDPRAMEGQMPAPWAHAALAAVGTAPLLVPVPASPNVVLTAALAVYVGAKRSVKPDPPEESMSKQVRAGTGTRTVPTMDRIQADGRLGDGDDGNRTRCVSR